MQNIIKRGDYYYPITDNTMYKYLFENDRQTEPERISKYCSNKRVCLQAGGNVGLYPIWFSRIFEQVITVEPEETNYECLKLNTKDYLNIFTKNAALGNENRKVGINISEGNSGGHNLGLNVKDGNIQMVRIDDLNLQNIDLIALDIEGFEEEALKGALETIKKYKPVICVETVWCRCQGFVESLGYRQVDEIDGNSVFVKND